MHWPNSGKQRSTQNCADIEVVAMRPTQGCSTLCGVGDRRDHYVLVNVSLSLNKRPEMDQKLVAIFTNINLSYWLDPFTYFLVNVVEKVGQRNAPAIRKELPS